MNDKFSRLRLAGWLEGSSLLLLVFIAVPLKYGFGQPEWTKIIGPIHGCFFLFFVFSVFQVSMEQDWKFSTITWKILLACLIPFGTFYVDREFLKNNHP